MLTYWETSLRADETKLWLLDQSLVSSARRLLRNLHQNCSCGILSWTSVFIGHDRVALIRAFGHFPFKPKFWKFQLAHQMESTILVWFDWNIRDQLWRWSTLTGQVISVGRTEFDKIVVPSAALLYPAYKNNNQTPGGLGRVYATGMNRSIGHVEFPKFQTGNLLNGKRPKSPKYSKPLP